MTKETKAKKVKSDASDAMSTKVVPMRAPEKADPARVSSGVTSSKKKAPAASKKKKAVKKTVKTAVAKKVSRSKKAVKKAPNNKVPMQPKVKEDVAVSMMDMNSIVTNLLTPPTPKTFMETTMMQQGQKQFEKLAQDAANVSREHAEAMIKSGNIFFKGFEEIVRTAASMAQTAAEKQAEFAKEAMSSKNLNDFASLQSRVTQANMDQFMAGATKLTEMSVKVLSESIEPISDQASKAMSQAQAAAKKAA